MRERDGTSVATEVEPAVFSIEESARYLGVGRSEMFALLREGAVGSFKRGRRRLIPRAELDKYIERQLAEREE